MCLPYFGVATSPGQTGYKLSKLFICVFLCLCLISPLKQCINKGVSLPSCGKKVLTSSVSMSSNIVSLILQNTGLGNHHNNRDVNPLALFCRSSIIGRADCGWVKPTNVNDVWFILKFAFPVTVIQKKINHKITVP